MSYYRDYIPDEWDKPLSQWTVTARAAYSLSVQLNVAHSLKPPKAEDCIHVPYIAALHGAYVICLELWSQYEKALFFHSAESKTIQEILTEYKYRVCMYHNLGGRLL